MEIVTTRHILAVQKPASAKSNSQLQTNCGTDKPQSASLFAMALVAVATIQSKPKTSKP